MHSANLPAATCAYRIIALSLIYVLASGCAVLRPTATPTPPTVYALDSVSQAPARTAPSRTTAAPVLLVSMPRDVPALDTRHILYIRHPHQLEYFVHSEWSNTPAHMLAPLVAAAMDNSGAFRAVLRAPSAARADLRLDLEVMELQQDFEHTPSLVQFALHAALIDEITRRVVASRHFEIVEVAPSANPYGGVIAANAAVARALDRLAAFAADTARQWRRPPSTD